MSKLSQETKDDITHYVAKKNLDLRFSDMCLSRHDVDVIEKCVQIVESSRITYLKAQQEAPHNVVANQKAIRKKWDKISFSTAEEGYDFMAYLHTIYPISSPTKEIKSEILDICRDKLKENNFSIRRIKKITPILTYILKDAEEEFEGLNEWVEELNKNNPNFL